MLLREVHQEGMQVLSLSELPVSEGEPGGRFNVQGWMKERDALLDTVESLKHIISQMQTHREPQVKKPHCKTTNYSNLQPLRPISISVQSTTEV